MTERYVKLHARSAFSFLEGASLPEAMTQQAANLELPGLAILGRDGLYGSPRLYTTAKKLGLRSHVGAKVEAFGQQARPPVWQPHTIPSRPVGLSFLYESQTVATRSGRSNAPAARLDLCCLSSTAMKSRLHPCSRNIEKVIHIRARHIEELDVTAAPMESHDFH